MILRPVTYGCRDRTDELSTRSQATQMAYGITQLPRVCWYLGQSLLLRELADATRQREEPRSRRRVHTNAPVPDRRRIYADMAKLFFQDLANVEAGIYPVPADHDGLKECLVPKLKRGDVVMMDSLPVHRVAGVREIIEAAGAKLRTFPNIPRISTRSSKPSANSRRISEKLPNQPFRASPAGSVRLCRHSARENAPITSDITGYVST